MPKPLNFERAVEADINRTQPEQNEAANLDSTREQQPIDRPALPGPPPRTVETAQSEPARKKRAKSRPSGASRPTAATASGRAKEVQVSVPTSLVQLADNDERSRSDLVRAAFNRHAEKVKQAARSVDLPSGPMMVTRPMRRRADPDDPFVPMLLRLTTDEQRVLDDAVASAGSTRSAFVSELLKHELT